MYSQKKHKNAEINIRIQIHRLKDLLREINSDPEESQSCNSDVNAAWHPNCVQMETELEKLERQIKELVNFHREEIIQSRESEGRRIARELHDGPAQSLASAIIRLDLLEQLDPERPDGLKKELDGIKDICRESLGDIRQIMFDLRPVVHNQGLAYTLTAFFEDYQAKYNFHIDFNMPSKIKKYDSAVEIAVLRLVQEAAANVRKHAGVSKALVTMDDNAGVLTLTIKDEGSGFNVNGISGASKESYGILGMKERVQLLGGEIEITSSRGVGTKVIIKVPVEGEESSGQN